MVGDFFIQLICKCDGFFSFPVDAFERQKVSPSESSAPHGAVFLVRRLGLSDGNRVQVDDVVEHAQLDRNQPLQHIRLHRARQIDRRQIADDEIARLADHHKIAVFIGVFFRNRRCRHILQNFAAQIAAVNRRAPLAAQVLIGILAVDFVAVEHIRRAGFELRHHNARHDVHRPVRFPRQ